MCVIIHKPKTAEFPERNLRACWDKNPDGWGIMFADEGRVHTFKDMDNSKFLDHFKALSNFDLGIHFRIKTHGLKNEANLHPFKVLDFEKDGVDLFMMHNGVLRDYEEVDREMSDTWHFANFVLYPLLKENPDLLQKDTFKKWMGSAISGSKLLFLDGKGKFTTVNQSQGTEAFGCWLSNSHSHVVYEAPARTNYPYQQGNYWQGNGGADSQSASRFPGWEHDDPYDIWWGVQSPNITKSGGNGSVGTAKRSSAKATTTPSEKGEKNGSSGGKTSQTNDTPAVQLALPAPKSNIVSVTSENGITTTVHHDGTISNMRDAGTTSDSASSGENSVVANETGSSKPVGVATKSLVSLTHPIVDDEPDLKEFVLGGKSEDKFELEDLLGLSPLELTELTFSHPKFVSNLLIKWLSELALDLEEA